MQQELFLPPSARSTREDRTAADAWSVAACLEELGFTGHRCRVAAPIRRPSAGAAPVPYPRSLRSRVTHRRAEILRSVLIIANRNDSSALQIAEDLRSLGSLRVVVSPGVGEIDISVYLDRQGQAAVDMFVTALGGSPDAILNRGGLMSGTPGPESFRNAEWYALWWAALALFPGPVVNRPNVSGYLPDVDVMSLVSSLEHWNSPAAWLVGDMPDDYAGESLVNTHDLACGAFVAQHASVRRAPDGLRAARCETPFNPDTVARHVLVGRRMFDLGEGHEVPLSQELRVFALAEELRARGADFCRIVTDSPPSGTNLLAVNLFPRIADYAGLRGPIHRALLEELWESSFA